MLLLLSNESLSNESFSEVMKIIRYLDSYRVERNYEAVFSPEYCFKVNNLSEKISCQQYSFKWDPAKREKIEIANKFS